MYYPIDETTAKAANDAFSMRDYRPGSATAEYRAEVDSAAALVQARKEAVSCYYHAKLDALLDSYSRQLADWYNRRNRNTASCPSVLICGGSNFPVAKKQRQNAREDKLMEEYRQIQAILDRIRSTGTGPIDFADPNARQMLQERITALEELQRRAKAMNAHYRKHKTMQGLPGLSDSAAAAMDRKLSAPMSIAQVPCPSYELTSIREKIKRARARLEEYDRLHSEKENPSGEGFQFGSLSGIMVHNAQENRLQLIFDQIPPEELRQALKSNGFRWSPRNQAWQRQLTAAAETTARHILGL